MPNSTYTARARKLHWWMAGLVVLAYLMANLIPFTVNASPERCFVIRTHFMAGIALLVLLAPRVRHRLRHAPPPIEPPLSGWEAAAAGMAHGLLYAFLLAQPLLGLASVWLAGHGIGIPLSSLVIPSPLDAHPEWQARAKQLHALAGTAFYYVIAAHLGGALWHRFGRRDDTLQRMLG